MEYLRCFFITFILHLSPRVSHGAYIADPSTCSTFPCVIFDDQFDFLDHDAWAHEINMAGGTNGEFQVYVNNRSVTYTRDGIFYIKPQLLSDMLNESFVTSGTYDLWGTNGRNEVCTGAVLSGCVKTAGGDDIINPIMSGRIRTLGSFSVKYGKVEVRAKLPSGDWIWPAIWMNPDGYSYGKWPASGEIDIMEARGNEVYGDISNSYAGSTLHWGPFGTMNRYHWTHSDYTLSDGTTFVDDFHTWTMEWNINNMTWALDGEVILFVDPITNFFDYGNFSQEVDINNPWAEGTKMAPFDQKFYLMLNNAIGGTKGYFPDNVPSNPPKPWINGSPTAMKDFWSARDSWLPTWEHGEGKISEKAALQIDYVTIYKLSPDDV